MCEHSRVSDAVALRREARRRKILENSANRLRLIEGVNSFGGPLPSESVSKSVAKFEAEGSKCNSSQNVLKETNSVKFETSSKFKDVIKQNEDWKKILNYLLENNEVESEESEVEVEETETVTVINQQKEDSFLNVLHKKKLHYVLLALTVNALLYFNLGYFFYEVGFYIIFDDHKFCFICINVILFLFLLFRIFFAHFTL